MSETPKKDNWDKFEIVVKATGVIAIALVGYFVNSTIQRRETSVKQIEIAIGVLKAKPDEASKELRMWAISVVNQFSEVPLSVGALEELKTNALPANILCGSDGQPIFTSDGPIFLN